MNSAVPCRRSLLQNPFLSSDGERRVRFLADRTATQYVRLLASSRRPSVCNAVHCGSHMVGAQG